VLNAFKWILSSFKGREREHRWRVKKGGSKRDHQELFDGSASYHDLIRRFSQIYL